MERRQNQHPRSLCAGWLARGKVSVKHLPAYLQEMTWRFNNRKNQYFFRDTLMRLLASENLEYKELTSEAILA